MAIENNDVVLENIFTINRVCHCLRLRETGLEWSETDNNTPENDEVEIIGRRKNNFIPIDQIVCIREECKGGKRSCFSGLHSRSYSQTIVPCLSAEIWYIETKQGADNWDLKHIIIRSRHDSIITKWLHYGSDLIRKQTKRRPKRLLVFVNPISGSRKAVKTYKNIVEPVFRMATIEMVVFRTKHRNNCRDILRTHSDLMSYDGICLIGGDGLYSEAVQGLASNRSIPISIIPCGSTNALACSIYGYKVDPLSATLQTVIGRVISIDLSSVFSKERLITYHTCMLSIGYFGDLLARAEPLRRIFGKRRYDAAGFRTLFSLQSIRVRITYQFLKYDCDDLVSICHQGCVRCSKSDSCSTTNQEERCIERNVMAVSVFAISCRCPLSKLGGSPHSHLGDGCATLVIVNECSRIRFIQYLIGLARNSVDAMKLPFVETIRTNEAKIEVSSSNTLDRPTWNCDGEIIRERMLHIKMKRQAVNLYGSGIDAEIKKRNRCSFCPWFNSSEYNEYV